MKKFLMLGGTIVILFGLLFVGQGLGYIRWPTSSFMISDTKWAYYGGGISTIGVFLLFIGHRQ